MSAIRTDNASRFEAIFPLYAQAFPRSEQKSAAAFRTLLRDPDYLVCTLDEGDRVLGFACFFVSEAPRFALLEYLAVDPEVRNSGMGSRLLRESLAKLFEGRGDRPVLIEIDATDDPRNAPINRRRERFYRANGCTKIRSLRYRLGLQTSTIPPAMEMMLYDPGRESLSRDELRFWIETIYTRVYGRDKEAPEIVRMFDPLPTTLELV